MLRARLRLQARGLDGGVAEMTKRIPMHKIGSLDDLKGLALLLSSDAGGHITGQTIVIDGGSAIV